LRVNPLDAFTRSGRDALDVRAAPAQPARRAGAGARDLPPGEAAVLTLIAKHTDGVSRRQLSALTDYKRSSRETYLRRLTAAAMIETPGPSTPPSLAIALS
jgi:hypothetical protein